MSLRLESDLLDQMLMLHSYPLYFAKQSDLQDAKCCNLSHHKHDLQSQSIGHRLYYALQLITNQLFWIVVLPYVEDTSNYKFIICGKASEINKLFNFSGLVCLTWKFKERYYAQLII